MIAHSLNGPTLIIHKWHGTNFFLSKNDYEDNDIDQDEEEIERSRVCCLIALVSIAAKNHGYTIVNCK